MTVKRVKSIAKREDQRRDDRSIMTRMRMADFLPRVTSEPKSGIVVRCQQTRSLIQKHIWRVTFQARQGRKSRKEECSIRELVVIYGR